MNLFLDAIVSPLLKRCFNTSNISVSYVNNEIKVTLHKKYKDWKVNFIYVCGLPKKKIIHYASWDHKNVGIIERETLKKVFSILFTEEEETII